MIPNLLQDAETYAYRNLSELLRIGMRNGYIEGRVIEHDRLKRKMKEWLRINYVFFDGSLDDLIDDFDKVIEEE